MSFKKGSSRFSRGEGQSQPARNEGGASRGSYSNNRSSGGGNNSNRSYDRGNQGGGNAGGGKDFPFTRIGSLTVPKSASDDIAAAAEDLRGSDLKFNCQIYLGKGDNELTLKNGDLLTISFKVSEKDKDFVLGHVAVKN